MAEREIFRDSAPGRHGAWIGIACAAAGVALWLVLVSRVHLDASGSDGAWGHLLLPLACDPRMGEVVLFDPPVAAGVQGPYLKTVRGLPGQRIEVDADRVVAVGGVALGRARTRAPDGRALAVIASGTVPPGRFYLHGEHPDSHDSRYAEVGLVLRERILGRAVALPDLPWLGLDGRAAGRNDGGDREHAVPGRIPAHRTR